MKIHPSNYSLSMAYITLAKMSGEEQRLPFSEGDIVVIKPEWRDPGDENFTWIALEDEDGGRVRIGPLSKDFSFQLNQVVRVDMLEPKLLSNTCPECGMKLSPYQITGPGGEVKVKGMLCPRCKYYNEE